jgi:NTE family protein
MSGGQPTGDARAGVAAAPAVTLVIGSGSVKCAASIGVVKVLGEAGIGIDRVVGCSAGALFASAVAFGYDAAAIADITLRTWTRKLTSKRNHLGMLQLLAPRLMGFRKESFGMRDDGPMLQAFRDVFGDRRIEDALIPLHLAATDFATGELVEMSRGPLVDALRATASLPLAFKPVQWEGRLVIDGYLAEPMPVSLAMRHGSRIIVAVGFESPYQEHIHNAGRFAGQLSAILANNLQRARMAFYSSMHHSEVILIVPQFRERIRLFDTHKVPYLIEAGEEAALEQLPYLRSLLEADRAALTPAHA